MPSMSAAVSVKKRQECRFPEGRVALLRDRRRERRRWGDAGETAVRYLNMITVPGQRAMTTRSPPLTRTA